MEQVLGFQRAGRLGAHLWGVYKTCFQEIPLHCLPKVLCSCSHNRESCYVLYTRGPRACLLTNAELGCGDVKRWGAGRVPGRTVLGSSGNNTMGALHSSQQCWPGACVVDRAVGLWVGEVD